MRGIHGEKLAAALESEKLPTSDIPRIKDAVDVYEKWIDDLKQIPNDNLVDIISRAVELLNDYKNYIDIELIFDSPDDFLYRQKGQLKIDNSVIEEFLPILVGKCLYNRYGSLPYVISSQTQTYSSIYFDSHISIESRGGGIQVKSKNQDFSISRKLYIKSSHSRKFEENDTSFLETNLGYISTEIKTNLDKTMFQEANATARDVKLAVTGAKYFLLCEWLDMTPISTNTSSIDEVIILRKAKRMNSNVRKEFSSAVGRQKYRNDYTKMIMDNPLSVDMFSRFVAHVFAQIDNTDLEEESTLLTGFF